ncbi:hypothetical protein D3C73_1385210 [compost metagenome]
MIRGLHFAAAQIDLPVIQRIIQIAAGDDTLSQRTAFWVRTAVLYGMNLSVRGAEYCQLHPTCNDNPPNLQQEVLRLAYSIFLCRSFHRALSSSSRYRSDSGLFKQCGTRLLVIQHFFPRI